RWILKEKDNLALRELMVVVIKRFVAMDPQAAFDALIPDQSNWIYLDEVIGAWTKLDPMAAFEAGLERFPSGDLLYFNVNHMENNDRQQVIRELLDRGFDKESPEQFLSVLAIAAGSMTE